MQTIQGLLLGVCFAGVLGGIVHLLSPDGEALSGFVFDEIASDGEIYAGRTGETLTVIPFSR